MKLKEELSRMAEEVIQNNGGGDLSMLTSPNGKLAVLCLIAAGSKEEMEDLANCLYPILETLMDDLGDEVDVTVAPAGTKYGPRIS
jgi:hypothetical protein